jgi:hypothetical protein
LLNTKCVCGFPLQLFSEAFLIVRRIQRNQKSTCPHVSCPLFFFFFSLGSR